jgi:hypothetical protein
VPSERVLAAMLVMLLVVVTVIGSGGNPQHGLAVPGTATKESAQVIATSTTGPEPTATNPPPTATVTTTTQPGPTATFMPGVAGEQPTVQVSADGAVLPTYRILSYYGQPNDPNLGILGEYPDDLTGLKEKLEEEAAKYQAADPSRPVKLAFEVIASVAQNWPAENDTYLQHTQANLIDKYADFAEQNDMLLILDVQIAHSTVKDEIESVRQWLERPNVHLALDPEFSLPSDVIPGEAIGSIDADDIAYAQDELGQIVDSLGLPPKLLIVHRFTEDMITNDTKLEAVPGVQLVIDFDGFGDPAIKQELYQLFTADKGVDFAGIKLFYQQDDPLMTPAEVIKLAPAPDLVIYQ